MCGCVVIDGGWGIVGSERYEDLFLAAFIAYLKACSVLAVLLHSLRFASRHCVLLHIRCVLPQDICVLLHSLRFALKTLKRFCHSFDAFCLQDTVFCFITLHLPQELRLLHSCVLLHQCFFASSFTFCCFVLCFIIAFCASSLRFVLACLPSSLRFAACVCSSLRVCCLLFLLIAFAACGFALIAFA
ncbi:hypothetical protein Tco_0539837 [Tanacetum coccineum]